MLHEVEDLHDARVGHLGEELAFGHRHGLSLGVAEVQQALENHPAVTDIAIDGQIDPAEAAVRDAALHLVLAADQLVRAEKRPEVVRGSALGAQTEL